MFNTYVHTAIDTIQNGKKEFVKSTVKHDQAAKILNEFVDAQTSYTKSAFDAGYDAAQSFYKLITDKNFTKDIQKSFQDVQDSTSFFIPDFLKPSKTGKK